MDIDPRLLEIATLREKELIEAIRQHGSARAASAALGMNPKAATAALTRARNRLKSKVAIVPTGTPLPDSDVEIEDVIGMMRRRFVKRYEYTKAKRWREFSVPTSGPYALMLFGDPHIDDDGCNWELLHSHCELAARTKHLYAVSIGDVTNNWTGRLAALYAQQETSVTTARKLIKWLMTESGVPWWLWIHGNHDAWSDGIPIIEGMNVNQIVMEDWSAKVTLASPNGHKLRLWATHNFKGHSMWNKLHVAQRAAQMSDWAHLYVAGHHHNWALHQEEHDERNFTYWLARVRGYKFIDSYADHHGFGHQNNGASILAVIDPTADKLNAVTCFADPFEGVEFLAYKRRKAA